MPSQSPEKAVKTKQTFEPDKLAAFGQLYVWLEGARRVYLLGPTADLNQSDEGLYPAVEVVELDRLGPKERQAQLHSLAWWSLIYGGVVIETVDGTLQAVRRVEFNPKGYEVPTDGQAPKVAFGSLTSPSALEESVIVVDPLLEPEKVQQAAAEFVALAKKEGLVGLSLYGIRIGNEIESLAYNQARPLTLPDSLQRELLRYALELDRLDGLMIEQQKLNFALLFLQKHLVGLALAQERQLDRQSVSVVSTSTPLNYPTYPREADLNQAEPYVWAMSQLLLNDLGSSDLAKLHPEVFEFMTRLAQNQGYGSLNDWLSQVNNLAPVFPAVNWNANISLPHFEGKLPLKWWVNLVDMFGSRLGAVPTFILGSPILRLTDDRVDTLTYDGRLATAMLTTAKRELKATVTSSSQALAQLVRAVALGASHTLDRAVATAGEKTVSLDGRDYRVDTVAGHAILRLRTLDGVEGLRLEMADASISSHIDDLVAAQSFGLLLLLAAMEAAAYGQTPQEFFKHQGFAPLLEVNGRNQLIQNYHTSSQRDEFQVMIAGAFEFVAYMEEHFNHESYQPLYVQVRRWLARLGEFSQAQDLTEFMHQPTGQVSEVIARMVRSNFKQLLKTAASFDIPANPDRAYEQALKQTLQQIRDFELAQVVKILIQAAESKEINPNAPASSYLDSAVSQYVFAQLSDKDSPPSLKEVVAWLVEVHQGVKHYLTEGDLQALDSF